MNEQTIYKKCGKGLFKNRIEESGWVFFNNLGNFDRETEIRSQYSDEVPVASVKKR